jgi:cobalt-zinc-cadmium efflux system outer membrane protein
MRSPPPQRAAWLVCLVVSTGLSATARAADPAPPAEAAPAAPATPVSLADLEQLALHGNPTLAQAAANVEAARGRAVQAGLYPNPTVGYTSELMGVQGTAGELQGLFIDQIIVTAGKLRLNRAKFGQEVSQMEAQALAQQYRVLNGVRTRYYQLLALQRLLDVRADLLKVAEDAVTTTEQLQNVGAANKPDVLQARIEARLEKVALADARALDEAAWRQLAAFVGQPWLPLARLEGDLEAPGAAPDYEAALAHLLEASPELEVARAEVARSLIGLKREQVEPISNVQVRVANGYDFETRNDVTSVQVGVRLPLFDKNQGNIRAAQAQVAHAQAEVCRVELSLRERLARTYARYRTALALAESYRKDNLPEAKEVYELYRASFRNRAAAWPQVLVAQRTYFQLSVDYIRALEQLRRSETEILGLLLTDGLEEPPGAPGESRTPQPAADLPDPISPQGGRSGAGGSGD